MCCWLFVFGHDWLLIGIWCWLNCRFGCCGFCWLVRGLVWFGVMVGCGYGLLFCFGLGTGVFLISLWCLVLFGLSVVCVDCCALFG